MSSQLVFCGMASVADPPIDPVAGVIVAVPAPILAAVVLQPCVKPALPAAGNVTAIALALLNVTSFPASPETIASLVVVRGSVRKVVLSTHGVPEHGVGVTRRLLEPEVKLSGAAAVAQGAPASITCPLLFTATQFPELYAPAPLT